MRLEPLCKAFALITLGAILVAGCAAEEEPTTAAEAAPRTPSTDQGREEELESRVASLEEALEMEREELSRLQEQNDELRSELREKQRDLASIEERYATLEIELKSAVEEVLRSKATIRGVQSRALATSRISEVRVEIESVSLIEDAEVAVRLRRANESLVRADQALEQGNFGGASYLAERASDLVRQARIVAEVRQASAKGLGEIIPVVPPRTVTVVMNSNLRDGPGLGHARVGGAGQGQQVLAVARSGEWFQVETDSGLVAWIHESLVD